MNWHDSGGGAGYLTRFSIPILLAVHQFHIPVMGTGHTIDSPIRVAHLGINSVISIVDDHLIERIRKHYCEINALPFRSVPRSHADHRAARIREYLDLVADLIETKFRALLEQPYGQENDKALYFRLLPDTSMIRSTWERLTHGNTQAPSPEEAQFLDACLQKGSADVNIMAKVDHLATDKEGKPLASHFSDACASLRGFAESKLESALVLSAGFNPRLYAYLTEFAGFYRDQLGHIRKKIVLKVSDFRSALIQGRFLAKKGLEVAEYRIESGLNCGGHAFATEGQLLPTVLREFQTGRMQLGSETEATARQYYRDHGIDYVRQPDETGPRVTVQGGVGTNGEMRRLLEDFGADAVGWGSPFLLVPEATCVDETTRRLLQDADEKDLYLSKVSPLGVPFNNLHGTGSETWTAARADTDKPGSPCPKGFLKSNTEFTAEPICTASTEYQVLKLQQIDETVSDPAERLQRREEVLAKACLCDHLGNGALISLGVLKQSHGKQAICPGPNIAWFDRDYSLRQMVDHIYGRTNLVPSHRPHMFAKELEMNVDYLGMLLAKTDPDDAKALSRCRRLASALLECAQVCRDIAAQPAFPGENLASLATAAQSQEARLQDILAEIEPVSV